MFDRYPMVLGEFYSTPWLITASRFDEIELALRARILNGPLAIDMPEAARPGKRELREVKGDIAILRVTGTLTARPSVMSSGGTSCREISAALDEMIAEPDVSAIVIDMNCPGGQAVGVEELGAKIAEYKKRLPIHCSVNHMAASGGYWLASQCSSISAAPSSTLGSIGVYIKHACDAKAEEMAGYSTTIVTAGRRKAETDSSRPLSAEAMASYEKQCSLLYDKFTAAVASGRGVSKDTVRSEAWGEGAIVVAEEAVSIGMADRIATLEEVVSQLRGKSNEARKRQMKMAIAKSQEKANQY